MKNSRAIEVSVAPMSHKTIKRRAEPESEGHDRGKALKVKARPLGGIGQEPQPSRRPMHDPEIDDGYNEKEDDDDDEDMEESGSEASGSGHDADGDKERNLQEQVEDDVPFEVLEALKQDGSGPIGRDAREAARAAQERSFHRANRHRPSEMSSKRAVPRFREVIQVSKRESVDPRFEMSFQPGSAVVSGKKGSLQPSSSNRHAERNYAFLYDEVIPEERKTLKDKMKREKNPKFKTRLQAQLTKLEQATRSEQERRKRSMVADEIRATEKKAVASGKKPYYLKKSEQRKMELLAKYKELKTGGGLEKFMEKRRKKNASKDHRYMPSQRRPEGE